MPRTLGRTFTGGVLAFMFAAAWGTPRAAAQIPAPVPLPNVWGPNEAPRALALEGDSLVVGGRFDYVGPPTGGFAVVAATDGRLIPTERSLTPTADITPDGEGGWFVLPGTSFAQEGPIRHVQADGTVDAAWRSPAFAGRVSRILARGERLYVAGSFAFVDAGPGAGAPFDWVFRQGLAALDASTGALLSWDARIATHSGGAGVTRMALDGDTLYVVGAFSAVGPAPRGGMAALDADTGAVRPAMFPAIAYPSDVYSLGAAAGRVYLSGNCAMRDGGPQVNLCGFSADGAPLPGWAPPANAGGIGPMVATADRLFVAGSIFTGTDFESRVRAFSPLTGLPLGWQTERLGPLSSVTAMTLADGRVYVGKSFVTPGSNEPRLMAFDQASGGPVLWRPNVSGNVTTMAVASGQVALGGTFLSAGGDARRSLATIDLRMGGLASVQPPEMPRGVEALARREDLVVAGGDGTLVAFSAATGTVYGHVPVNGWVFALAIDDATLYVGGRFESVRGVPRRNLAAIDLRTGVVSSWDPQPDDTVTRLIVSSGALYAVGQFRSVPGYGRAGIAAFDLQSGALLPFSPRPYGAAYDLAFYRYRVLLAGPVGLAPYSQGTQWVDRVLGEELPFGRMAPFLVNSVGRMGDVIVAGGQPVPGFGNAGLIAIDAITGDFLPWAPFLGRSGGSVSVVGATADFVAVGGWFGDADGIVVSNLAVFPVLRAGAPTHMTARVEHATVTLAWQPGAPPVAQSYSLEVGTSRGAADVGTFPLGTLTRITGSLPAGTYFTRVRGIGRTGAGAAGSEVIVTLPAPSLPPEAPSALAARVSVGVVTLTWTAAAGNATTYVIEAGTASGLANLGAVATGHLDTAFVAAVPPGTYHVRVRAANAFGVSAATNDVTVVVP